MTCAAAILGARISARWRVSPRRIHISTVDGRQLAQERLAAMINREPGSMILHDAGYGRRGPQWQN